MCGVADWLYLATTGGLGVYARAAGGDWREVRRALRGQRLTSGIAREGVVPAGSAAGVQRSDDGGANWALRHHHYARARWLDPDDQQHILLGPAASVGERGRIEVSRGGGESWNLASGGLPALWPRDRMERFIPASGELLAVMDGGRLFVSPLRAWQWRQLLPEAGHVSAAAFVSGG